MSRRSILLTNAAGFFSDTSPGGGGNVSVNALNLPNTSPVFATDYLQSQSVFSYNANYSIMGWFRANEALTTWLFSIASAADTTNIDALFYDSTNHLILNTKMADASQVDFTGPSTVATATWFHAAMVRSSGTIGMYLNGTLEGAFQASNVTGRAASIGFTIGNNQGGAETGHDLSTCLVRIYTAALSQAEISAEMLASSPVRTAGLFAHYPLSSTTDLADSTAAQPNLLLQGDEAQQVPGPNTLTS